MDHKLFAMAIYFRFIVPSSFNVYNWFFRFKPNFTSVDTNIGTSFFELFRTLKNRFTLWRRENGKRLQNEIKALEFRPPSTCRINHKMHSSRTYHCVHIFNEWQFEFIYYFLQWFEYRKMCSTILSKSHSRSKRWFQIKFVRLCVLKSEFTIFVLTEIN